MMEIRYNITGAKRKEMAQIIGKVLETEPVYLRVPTCAYAIGKTLLTKEGSLIIKGLTQEDVKKVVDSLAEAGYEAENAPTFENLGAIEEAYEQAQEPETEEPEEAPAGLTISLPRKDLSDEKLKDLQKLLRAKEDLIMKALDADRLTVEITEDQVSFPWFDRMPDADEIKAYMHFITALIKLVKKSKRVTATKKNVDNEKYTFRCLLLRLGFIGDRSKKDRKILLKNLSGSSAFRKGGKE